MWEGSVSTTTPEAGIPCDAGVEWMEHGRDRRDPMGSISRGFRLAKASWAVVRGDSELLVLPVVSFFCSLVVMAVFGLGIAGVGLPQDGESVKPVIYVLGFVMYVLLSFVTIFFNAAVIGTAMKRLKGEDASIKDGLALARQHLGPIFVWALITATVGMIA